jgi:hypothetical protein
MSLIECVQSFLALLLKGRLRPAVSSRSYLICWKEDPPFPVSGAAVLAQQVHPAVQT